MGNKKYIIYTRHNPCIAYLKNIENVRAFIKWLKDVEGINAMYKEVDSNYTPEKRTYFNDIEVQFEMCK